jgi:nucleoside-diphosphate-sugar epimerase
VLVTGATGFVGRSLCRVLLDRGHEVAAAVRGRSAIDRLPPGVQAVTVGDIGPDTDWRSALLKGIDVVAHLAARVHVLKETAADPAAEFHRVNVAGTERLAQAAAGRVRRLVYVSSVHAMCTLSAEPLTEASPCRPETPYGMSKLQAEHTLQQIGEKTGLQTVLLRPPPVYGPGGAGNLARLLGLARSGWPLPLGGIDARRSLVYVGNLADALAACIEHPAAAGETFLVSDGEDVSLSDLVRHAAAATGCRARLLPAPTGPLRLAARGLGKAGAVDRLLGSLVVDSSKIRERLGWQPPHTLAEGLFWTLSGHSPTRAAA